MITSSCDTGRDPLRNYLRLKHDMVGCNTFRCGLVPGPRDLLEIHQDGENLEPVETREEDETLLDDDSSVDEIVDEDNLDLSSEED